MCLLNRANDLYFTPQNKILCNSVVRLVLQIFNFLLNTVYTSVFSYPSAYVIAFLSMGRNTSKWSLKTQFVPLRKHAGWLLQNQFFKLYLGRDSIFNLRNAWNPWILPVGKVPLFLDVWEVHLNTAVSEFNFLCCSLTGTRNDHPLLNKNI